MQAAGYAPFGAIALCQQHIENVMEAILFSAMHQPFVDKEKSKSTPK